MAGVVAMVVALGIAELVHGLYQLVPTVLGAVAQRLIVLTPGSVTELILGTLGKAATPILISIIVVSTLAFAGLLANAARRSSLLALGGVAVLAAVAILAALFEPSVSPIATVLTILGSLALGSLVAWFLLRSSGLVLAEPARTEEPVPEEPRGTRAREAHSEGGIAVGRRNFLLLGGSAAVAGLAAGGVGRALASRNEQIADNAAPLKTSGESPGGPPVPPPDSVSVGVEGVPPWVTPNKDFYLIDTAVSSPQLDRDSWKLSIKGAVDNPIEMTYDELVSMPNKEAYITMACVSNKVGGKLISNALWTGVLLSDVLAEAGVSRDKITRSSEQLVGRSVDGWTSGFRTEIALDGREALVAFGMNGSELPLKHGYPVRLVVPGLYGYVSATKWITEMELTDWDFDAYWIQRNWAKEGPIKTQSRIDTVMEGQSLSAGRIPIGGIAWAPTRGIERVEVTTDGGESWNEARLAKQLDIDTWRQYVYEWEAKPGEHTLQVRATDGNGETQTAKETKAIPSGATGYHTVNVTVQ
jgi:DMSO/TMAO reductase YedYZ molybdopterin-dependent catalytic subunit